jgi:hypothetical protein
MKAQLPKDIHIKENSWLARLAAAKLKSNSVALVMGKTIHLHGVDRHQFLQNPAWVRHELKHVEQYQRLGKMNFLAQYLAEWIRHGYHNNRFEIEAREAEDEIRES